MVEEGLPESYTLTPAAIDGEALSHSWGYNGRGEARYTNGDVFVGDFVDGKKHGKGVYTYHNGDVFEGKYENNKRTGLAKMFFADGTEYHGHFENGMRNGEGTMRYPGGDIYSGSWKDGKKDGSGFYVFATSKYFYKGTWSKGQLVNGSWNLGQNCKFEGDFKMQKPVGNGKWCFPGYYVKGSYAQEVKPLNKDGKIDVDITWTTDKLRASA